MTGTRRAAAAMLANLNCGARMGDDSASRCGSSSVFSSRGARGDDDDDARRGDDVGMDGDEGWAGRRVWWSHGDMSADVGRASW